MTNRWAVLALLFAIRCTMGFQFQTAAALSPTIMQTFGVGIADLGLLVGLYLSPGILLAAPSGGLARRYGDKTMVAVGLGLMIAGGAIMIFAESWEGQIAGRAVAGFGGVLLNVLMSKMVADWFAGREIATAMGIFVNSWPVGIALALAVAPAIAGEAGLSGAHAVAVALAAAGLLALAAFYRQPAQGAAAASAGGGLSRAVMAGVIVAGSIWGVYNAGLAMIFSFGPAMLAERGWSEAAASSATSIVLWLAAISIPFGGFLADRTGRLRTVMIGCFVLFAAALPIAARTEAVIPMFVVLGLVSGLAAGPIMALPAQILSAENRAIGMGVFLTIYYIAALVGPVFAGWVAELRGSAVVTFDLGAAMLVGCCLLLWLFDRCAALSDERT